MDGNTLDTWLRFFAIVVTQLVVALGIWANLRSKLTEAKTKLEDVGDTAQEAVELSRPTANGYAGRTISALTRIEGAVTELARPGGRIDRIQAELQEVRGVVTRHIESHADDNIRRRTDTEGR